jgi:predicted transcriptional regulator
MDSKRERDYISKHIRIREKMIDLTRENECACIDVAQLASKLGMDKRTIRSHLKIMELDAVGVFMDPDEKQFCTKEGIALLANILNLKEKFGKSDSGPT